MSLAEIPSRSAVDTNEFDAINLINALTELKRGNFTVETSHNLAGHGR